MYFHGNKIPECSKFLIKMVTLEKLIKSTFLLEKYAREHVSGGL
jgi:hypothetical protein